MFLTVLPCRVKASRMRAPKSNHSCRASFGICLFSLHSLLYQLLLGSLMSREPGHSCAPSWTTVSAPRETCLLLLSHRKTADAIHTYPVCASSPGPNQGWCPIAADSTSRNGQVSLLTGDPAADPTTRGRCQRMLELPRHGFRKCTRTALVHGSCPESILRLCVQRILEALSSAGGFRCRAPGSLSIF